MPAVSFYLNQNVLESVRAKAKETGRPVSAIISDAVNLYIQGEEEEKAKTNVLKLIQKHKGASILGRWEDLHKERDSADAGRH